MTWLDKEHLSEDVVALGRGKVEAAILDAAANVISRKEAGVWKIEEDCERVVMDGYVREVAEGKYDDENKLRALLVLGNSLYMPDYFPISRSLTSPMTGTELCR